MLELPRSQEMMAQLGPPSWIADPVGARPIDTNVVRIGQSAPGSPRVRVAVGDGSRPGAIVRLQIADQDVQGSPVPILQLPEGMYILRVSWADGTSTDTYLLAECERGLLARPDCYTFRSFDGLRYRPVR